jgi:hypothetical protein
LLFRSRSLPSAVSAGPGRYVVESEFNLLGTDYDNEGKPIAYFGREAEGGL